MVDALYVAGWRPPGASAPAPVPAPQPAYKATLDGNELTIVRIPTVTVRTVERDKKGQIVRTVDVEEDAL